MREEYENRFQERILVGVTGNCKDERAGSEKEADGYSGAPDKPNCQTIVYVLDWTHNDSNPQATRRFNGG
jgi:hypothetical protein